MLNFKSAHTGFERGIFIHQFTYFSSESSSFAFDRRLPLDIELQVGRPRRHEPIFAYVDSDFWREADLERFFIFILTMA